ncbi:uncharacterized protein LOC132549871 [Ylistrum balloti]|uniref:uncharacterized protein LOC132549871 n=1 Tax=Ylistrum balloti TaxID=509963 RepID=UPI002905AC1F|nr:uncharacterized protein LOC132549871 [Ylistrum balloti]
MTQLKTTTALVCPYIEYASSVWSPHKKKDMAALENVQRRATRMLPQMKNIEYEQRLNLLKLPTLKFRRMRGDMIEVFKILKGIYDPTVTTQLLELNNTSTTRGNSLKLAKKQCTKDIKKYSFSYRIVDTWNSLPEQVITAATINQFKNRLDKY